MNTNAFVAMTILRAPRPHDHSSAHLHLQLKSMDIIAERVSDWSKDSSAQDSSPTSRLGLRPPPEADLTFVDKIDALVRVVEARTEMDTVRSSFVPHRCDGERLPLPDADNRPLLYVRDRSAPDFSQQKDQHSAGAEWGGDSHLYFSSSAT